MLTTVNTSFCQCSQSWELVCSKCGLPVRIISFDNSCFDEPTLQWFEELRFQNRLGSTLAFFRAIDRQILQGAPLSEVVHLAVKEIGQNLSGLGSEIDRRIQEKFDEFKINSEDSGKQLRELIKEITQQQNEAMLTQIRQLIEQGKTLPEIETRLRETAQSIQTYITSIQIPAIKAEEGELITLKSLQDAFFGVTGVSIEPIGGPDATDAVTHFKQNGVEIGKSLIEIKSRRKWSNDNLDQIKQDMKRYQTPLAIIVSDTLPRNARGKGFAIDADVGIVVITTPDMVVQTVTMFYEIHITIKQMQKTTLDLDSIASKKNILFYINDNLKCLDDCKKISDVIEDTKGKVHELLESICQRLRGNNRAIVDIISKTEKGGNE